MTMTKTIAITITMTINMTMTKTKTMTKTINMTMTKTKTMTKTINMTMTKTMTINMTTTMTKPAISHIQRQCTRTRHVSSRRPCLTVRVRTGTTAIMPHLTEVGRRRQQAVILERHELLEARTLVEPPMMKHGNVPTARLLQLVALPTKANQVGVCTAPDDEVEGGTK